MERKDCFAYCRAECKALKELYCKENRNCKFYQNREKFLERANKLGINVKLPK